MSEDYQNHRVKQHQAATLAHAKWIKSLTPAQLKLAKENKLIDPPKDTFSVGGKCPDQKKDIADTPIAQVPPEEIKDTPIEIIADKFGVSIITAQKIHDWHEQDKESESTERENRRTQTIVAGILLSNTPKLAAAGLAFAVSLDDLNNINQSDFAKENHISRSNVSKETKRWQRLLNLKTSVHQKSSAACKEYSKTATTNHWRNKIYRLKKIT
jgi:hypothetical protein